LPRRLGIRRLYRRVRRGERSLLPVPPLRGEPLTLTFAEWGSVGLALPLPPPSRHQSTHLPASKRALKAPQRILTTPNCQDVRFGSLAGAVPLRPGRTFALTEPRLYAAPGFLRLTPWRVFLSAFRSITLVSPAVSDTAADQPLTLISARTL
jgi:hypothetical protein